MHSVQVPDPLPYPKISDFSEMEKLLKDVFCYTIEKYADWGIAAVVVRENNDVCIRLADWDGNLLDPNNLDKLYKPYIETIMKEHIRHAISILSGMGVPKCILYFASNKDGPALVDIRWDGSKWASPGLIRDFFSKNIPIQKEIEKPIVVNSEILETLLDGKGDYNKSMILKPSAFKITLRDREYVPAYGLISHETKSST